MNPMMPLLYAEAFWQDYQTPIELLMVLVVSGVLVKWVVDDFRHSRLSAITWLLAVLIAPRTHMGCDVCGLPR